MTWRSDWRLKLVARRKPQQLRPATAPAAKAHEVWLGYSVDDLERERVALRRLGFWNRKLEMGSWKLGRAGMKGGGVEVKNRTL
jgi:hypothetical protein